VLPSARVGRTTFTLVYGALALAFGAAAEEQARLLGIRTGGDDRTSGVVIKGDRPLSFTTLKLTSPPRVVVDFADSEIAAESRELEIGDGTLKRAALAQAGAKTARVVIELVADAEFDIRTDGNEVEVRVPRPVPLASAAQPQAPAQSDAEAEKVASLPKVSLVGSPVPAPDAGEPERSAERAASVDKPVEERVKSVGKPPPRAKAANQADRKQPVSVALDGQQRHITGIGFRPVSGGEVIVRSDLPLEYGVSGDDGAVLLHLPSAAIPIANNRRPLETRFFDGAVQRVVPVPVAGGTDVRIELREPAEYQLAQNGSVLTVTFSSPR
jgi:AMIN domain